MAAYDAKEREFGQPGAASDIEIVLIGSDSIDTVKLTHANYFNGSEAVSRYLVGVGRNGEPDQQ